MKKIVLLIVLILTFDQHVQSQTKIGDLYYTFSGENATVVSEDARAWGGYKYDNERYDIPSTVTYNGLSFTVVAIDNQAFGGFPNTYLGDGYASKASVFRLPITIKSIGYAAFYACKNVVSMIIPPDVTYIGKYAFTSCDLLRELIYTGAIAPDGWYAISKTYVPDLQAYSSPTYRSSDARIIEMISFDKHEFEYTSEMPITTWTNNVEGYSVSLSMPSLNTDMGNHEVVIPATFTKDNESFTANIVYRYTIKPQKKTYILSVRSVGNGSVSYNTTMFKNGIQSFTLNESSSATIIFTPDDGCQIKNVKVNSIDVTSNVTNNQYTVNNINANTTVEVEYEATTTTSDDEPTLSGQCGDNVYYSYDITTHTLTISGEGDMWGYDWWLDYPYKDNRPWLSFLNDIFYLIIESGVTSIGMDAFDGCKNLTSVSIGNGVITFDWRAFAGCHSLTSIIMPTSLTSVKMEAFEGCKSLISISIPPNVTFLDDSAFENCSNLASLTVEDGNLYFDSRNNCNAIIEKSSNTLIAGCKNTIIPNSVVSIGAIAFSGRDGLTSMTIPNSVKSIGSGAFAGCGLTTIVSEIENPFEISSWTFSDDAYNVATLIVPKGTKAAYQATEGWNKFANIVEAGDDSTISGQCGENVYYSYDETTHTLTISGEGDMRDYYRSYEDDNRPWLSYLKDIQSVIVKSGVSNIGECAFSGCVNLTSVSIGNSVTSIGFEAFDGCTKLTSIIIPNSVTSIGEKSFSNCSGLISITIPESVGIIGEKAFAGCGIQSITILGSLSIWREAFEGCVSLTAVHISDLDSFLRIGYDDMYLQENTPLNYAHHLYLNGEEIKDLVIPNTIKEIKDMALSGGSSLTSVTIPSSVTSIGVRAFWNCSSLPYITIPNSVTSINLGAFEGCSSLNAVTIPNSVTTIREHAFEGCSSLSSVVSEIGNPYAISNSVFEGIPSDAQLIVPKGTKAAYETTEGWNQFTNIVEAGESESDQPGQIHIDDIYYKVTVSGEAEVVSADNGVTSITIPSTVSSYKVTSIAKDAFVDCEHLAAVIWDPEVQFNANVNNPNFLLYVSDEKYASHTVKNVVVNGVAESIELTDDANGNDFYCPRVFRAKNIIYKHNYQMETGLGDSKGWETIVLPFDVQRYTHATKGELESFTTWSKGSNNKPFWLFELTASGYKDVADIKANTPYIISMPNNQQYEQQYQIPGVVTFSASDVDVQKSDNLKSVSYQDRTFVPNYTNQNNADFLALNVSNNYVTNPSKEIAGSKFIRGLRAVHPFEAYMTTPSNTRSIDVMDGMTTAIRGIQMVKDEARFIKVYDTRGVLMKAAISLNDARKGLKAGVYIVNGKKMVIK